MFPQSYRGGAFVGEHGSWNRQVLNGYKVVFVPFENGRPSGPPRDILSGFLAADEKFSYGRPVGVTLGPDGSLLVAGRRITGYSWVEEILAGVAKKVPYNVEQQMQQRGARYEKALLPFTSNVVVDGRLVTGQNPQSAKATAEQVVALL